MSALPIQQSTHGDIQSVATGSNLADPRAVAQAPLDCGAISKAEFDALRVEVPA